MIYCLIRCRMGKPALVKHVQKGRTCWLYKTWKLRTLQVWDPFNPHDNNMIPTWHSQSQARQGIRQQNILSLTMARSTLWKDMVRLRILWCIEASSKEIKKQQNLYNQGNADSGSQTQKFRKGQGGKSKGCVKEKVDENFNDGVSHVGKDS